MVLHDPVGPDVVEDGRGRDREAEVRKRRPALDRAPLRVEDAAAHERRHDREVVPGPRDGERRLVVGLDDELAGLIDDRRADARPCLVRERPQRTRAKRVQVATAVLLGEVHVAVRLLDMPDDGLVRGHVLAAPHDGDHVPVAELHVVRPDDRDGRRVQRVDVGGPAHRRVDRRAVRCGDVDAEVELARLAVVGDPRISEEPAHRVLQAERLDGPGIGVAVSRLGLASLQRRAAARREPVRRWARSRRRTGRSTRRARGR